MDSYEQLHGSVSPSPEIKAKHLMEDVVVQRNSATWKDGEKKTPTMQLLKGMKSLNQNYFCKSFGKMPALARELPSIASSSFP